MTNLRNIFLATAFAASLPAMAASPPPVTIDFEMTATPKVEDYDGNVVPGTGGGQAVGSAYAAYGVTFDEKAFSFYSNLNPAANYGKNVDNLPLLASGSENNVFMAPYQVSPECADSGTCPTFLTSISTVATITKAYNKVEFSYSADIGSGGQVTFVSSKGATTINSSILLTANTKQLDSCDPSSSMWWCQWNPVSYSAPTGFVLQSIEFTGREGAIFYDNIILTPPAPVTIPVPEPSTYALTLFGLVGIRFLAVRRRRPD
jgi:hypothetical protein